ncbi:uncharacterized protein LOC105030291 isoform X3 [Esox lucius]|uniref:uncharacterized protein LOC105030291 isoform X3 n=1 Tax=Esox lucius TaxID=8010 RepID=UPI001476F951|nr:uncharacterized protein LOC105030291 isoform X3 [Esox lucius]
MDFRRQERQWLTHLLIIVGLCFSISQTGEEMLTQVVGGSITFSNSTKQEPVSRPMLTTAGNQICSVECSVKNDRDVTLSWYNGEEILNQTSSPDHSIKLFLPLEVDKQDRTSYRCEAANPVTKKNVTFHVPESCPETKVTDNDIERVRGSLIGAVMCVLVASGVLGLAIYLKKGRNRDVQDSSEREQAVLMYAEVTHSKPKHNQELGPCNENPEGRSVYDQIQLHRMEKCDNGQ